MEPCELSASITAAANAIAKCLDNERLNILALILTQLGDTLALIAAQREALQNKNCKENSPSSC